MSGGPLKIMVDANVWVDSFCAEHTESLAARVYWAGDGDGGVAVLSGAYRQGRAVRCPTRAEA